LAPGEVLDSLFGRLRQAEEEKTAEVIEKAIQAVWLRSGSPTADVLMRQAGAAMSKEKFRHALVILDTVVELNPDYIEGLNRRATVHYLRGDYTSSLKDIERVLALEPRHFGALSGLGSIYKSRGEGRKALKVLRRARSIHPHLDGIERRIRELELDYDQSL
jgi:tetratricopeptide (TPR) repeat protein